MKKLIFTLSIILSLVLPTMLAPVHVFAKIGEGIAPPEIYIPKDKDKVLPSFEKGYGEVVSAEKVLDTTVVSFINLLSNIFIGFSVLFIIVAGLQYVLAQGDDEKIKKSHRSVAWAILGIVLIMLSYGIVYIINTLF